MFLRPLLGLTVGLPLGVLGHRWWLRRRGDVPSLNVGDEVKVGAWPHQVRMVLTEIRWLLNSPTEGTLQSTEVLLRDRVVPRDVDVRG